MLISFYTGASMFQHNRKQHPVGQGFFHSAYIKVGKQCIRYAYDCGSDNLDSLALAIDDYCSDLVDGDRLDVLFISHLDSDHVNGLDALLTRVNANTVVLPYLDPFERILLVASALSTDSLNGLLLSFATDPVRWLEDRGVNSVVFITGNERDNEEITFPNRDYIRFDQLRDYASEEPRLELDLDAARLAATTSVDIADDSNSTIEHLRVPHTTPLGLLYGPCLVNWAFITFTHPEIDNIKKFKKLIRKLFPLSGVNDAHWTLDNSRWLINVIQNQSLRDKLKSCYNHIRKNHNLISLSLYSGPAFSDDHKFYTSISSRGFLTSNCDKRCAWLGTGDSNMSVRKRVQALINHYRNVLHNVLTVTAPHHGSRHNIDRNGYFIGLIGSYYVSSAAAESRHGHPHAEVVNMIHSAGKVLFNVTEYPGSTLVELITPFPFVE